MVMDNTNLKESFELQIDLIEDKMNHLQSLKGCFKKGASQSSKSFLEYDFIFSSIVK
mgnify:CR=1 FL=1